MVPILFLFNCAAFAADWVRVASPRAEVYSDAGIRVARQTLDRLESLAAVFAEFGRNSSRTDRVKVLVFASESDYDRYKPSKLSAGFYQSGPGGDWIAFAAGAGDRVVLHEYTHLLLNRGVTRLPQWLEEGLAEYFSTVRVSGTQVRLGNPIPEHVANLKLLEPLSPEELSRVNKQSIHYSDPLEATRFYATSWALVHMLYAHPDFARHMPLFVDAIDRGTPNPFQESFGIPLEKAMLRVRPYISLPGLPSGTITLPEPLAETTGREPESNVPLPVILRLQAELLLDCGKREEAARKYNEIARRFSGNALALEALAFLSLSEDRSAEALQRFEQLVEGRTDASARAVFEYAMLLRDTGKAKRERVDALLDRTLVLNPNHPEARFLLGVRATDDKRYSDAVEHLRQATSILPRQFPFWHALSFAQYRLGQFEEARKSAAKAQRLAQSPEEDRMAADLASWKIDAAQPPATGGARRDNVRVPSSWSKPVSNASVSGTLETFVCAGDRPRLQVKVSTSGRIEDFVIADPRALELRNAAGNSHEMQFSCGKLDPPAAVRLEFDSATRSVTVIEFQR